MIAPYGPVKFYTNPVLSFENLTIWIFLQVWLEMPIHAPKFWFLGVWTTKRDWSSSRPTKGTFLATTALTCHFLHRSVHWCDLCARKKIKKGEKKQARKETYSGKLGVRPDLRPPTLTQRYVALHVGWYSSFKFLQNRLNGFRDVGVEICHFLYLRLSEQQLSE